MLPGRLPLLRPVTPTTLKSRGSGLKSALESRPGPAGGRRGCQIACVSEWEKRAVESLLEVEGLSKRFGPITAVDDVSFTLARGEVLGFLGPNGAGKTTTMRMITG